MATDFPPLKNDLLLRAARGIVFANCAPPSPTHFPHRRADRAGTSMGHATGRKVSSWYIPCAYIGRTFGLTSSRLRVP